MQPTQENYLVGKFQNNLLNINNTNIARGRFRISLGEGKETSIAALRGKMSESLLNFIPKNIRTRYWVPVFINNENNKTEKIYLNINSTCQKLHIDKNTLLTMENPDTSTMHIKQQIIKEFNLQKNLDNMRSEAERFNLLKNIAQGIENLPNIRQFGDTQLYEARKEIGLKPRDIAKLAKIEEKALQDTEKLSTLKNTDDEYPLEVKAAAYHLKDNKTDKVSALAIVKTDQGPALCLKISTKGGTSDTLTYFDFTHGRALKAEVRWK